MKKFLILLSALVYFSSGSFGQANKFQSMVGLWEMVGEQESGGGLQIKDSSTISIRFMGEEKTILRYNIDFSKSPIWFDFSCRDTATVSNFKSLIEFVGDDTLKWQIFTDGERADHFTSRSGELFYLKRVRPKSNTALYSGN